MPSEQPVPDRLTQMSSDDEDPSDDPAARMTPPVSDPNTPPDPDASSDGYRPV